MFSRIQLYIYVALAMGLMVTALALSIDGDTFGSVLMAACSLVAIVAAMARDHASDYGN